MANAAEVVGLLITEYAQRGITSTAEPIMMNGVPAWQITVRQPGYIDQIANIEDWIVLGSQGPGGDVMKVYPNLAFLATFTADVPLAWGATSTAPTATAEAGGKASIVVTQPTSPNGPWTYTVEQTTAGTSTAAALSGDPVIDAEGNVTLTVTGLTAGSEYTFTATVAATLHSDVTPLTSLASNAVTATA